MGYNNCVADVSQLKIGFNSSKGTTEKACKALTQCSPTNTVIWCHVTSSKIEFTLIPQSLSARSGGVRKRGRKTRCFQAFERGLDLIWVFPFQVITFYKLGGCLIMLKPFESGRVTGGQDRGNMTWPDWILSGQNGTTYLISLWPWELQNLNWLTQTGFVKGSSLNGHTISLPTFSI